MIVAVADTHAIIWYLLEDRRLSTSARSYVELAAGNGDQIGISTISLAELVYLEEKERVQAGLREILIDALSGDEPLFTEFNVDRRVTQVMRDIPRNEVPDMPDRIISATAVLHKLPLITRDGQISGSFVQTIW